MHTSEACVWAHTHLCSPVCTCGSVHTYTPSMITFVLSHIAHEETYTHTTCTHMGTPTCILCICLDTHTQTYTHGCMHTHPMCTHAGTLIHTCAHLVTHCTQGLCTLMCVCICAHIWAQGMLTQVHSQIYMYIFGHNTLIHIHPHMWIHAHMHLFTLFALCHTHTYTHAHTGSQALPSASPPGP